MFENKCNTSSPNTTKAPHETVMTLIHPVLFTLHFADAKRASLMLLQSSNKCGGQKKCTLAEVGLAPEHEHDVDDNDDNGNRHLPLEREEGNHTGQQLQAACRYR
jgi:hypothetical protein